jgi:hypothetical protein
LLIMFELARVDISQPVALLIGFALVPVGYAIAWAGGRLLDWWTRPRA